MARGIAEVCGLLLAMLGCGGRATTDDRGSEPDDAAKCRGDVTLKGDSIQVDEERLGCELGVVVQESGMANLELAFGDGGRLSLNLPSVTSGSYDSASCAFSDLSYDASLYELQGSSTPLVPTTSVQLDLTRVDDTIQGRLESELCAVVGSRFQGDALINVYACLSLSIPNLWARLEPGTASCNCPATNDPCTSTACRGGSCQLVQCPRGAPICEGS